jgi:hypothetical protein
MVLTKSTNPNCVAHPLNCRLLIPLPIFEFRRLKDAGMTKINSTTRTLVADACLAALAAFGIGLCFGCAFVRQDRLCFTGMIIFSAVLIFVLLWTRRAAQQLATSESAKKSASTFLWSCIFFSMLSSSFGLAVFRFVWSSPDFLWRFDVVFWSVITGVAIYPVCRDAKRLADAAP